ncbi:unnamed protein product [Rodentolepis nana]|uniref:Uncharacterized protein n=1 Tax=Rodentolepis nana TaxID=102285 RepID=A0A0R3TMI5_RODNA|nr:unnamed protein product [Rodentolepis nana]
MFSTRTKSDSSTFSNKLIRNTVVPEANSTTELPSPPTIHVHHFHHHSCLHHPEVLCQNPQPTGSLESSNEYQYAVILNPNSPLGRTTQSSLASKQSAFTYARKPAPIVTATIRHPIETSLPLQRRYFHSPEPPQRSHSSSNYNPNGSSFTSQMSSPCFLSWDQQHQHQYQYHHQQNQCLSGHANRNECSFANGINHHNPPPSPCSRVITKESLQQNASPAHVISGSWKVKERGFYSKILLLLSISCSGLEHGPPSIGFYGFWEPHSHRFSHFQVHKEIDGSLVSRP